MSKSTTTNQDTTYILDEEFLINEFNYEDKNEIDTLKFIRDSSNDALKKQFVEIGSALSILSQIASCKWGCSKGDHLKENLFRRLANYNFSTIRLVNLGLYNEALSLIRSTGELANLIQLFSIDETEFPNWTSFSSQERWLNYKPEKVRSKINECGEIEIMSHETYSELCEIGIHLV